MITIYQLHVSVMPVHGVTDAACVFQFINRFKFKSDSIYSSSTFRLDKFINTIFNYGRNIIFPSFSHYLLIINVSSFNRDVKILLKYNDILLATIGSGSHNATNSKLDVLEFVVAVLVGSFVLLHMIMPILL